MPPNPRAPPPRMPPKPRAAAGLDSSMQDMARSKPQSISAKIDRIVIELLRMANSRYGST
jgi:hypothetical protein